MSNSEDSTITYTAVSSPFRGLSDIESPGVVGPPVMPKDPYAYVVAAFQAPPSLDYVSGPEYPPLPEFVPEPGDEEEDEYLAPADSTVVALPAIDHAPSAEETEPFKIDESAATPPPHPAYNVTVRMSIKPQIPISLPSDREITRLMVIPTPPPSPLSPLSSPLPQIQSPPLPLLSPPPTNLTYEEAPLGYRVAKLRWRAEREEIPKADLPLQKRLCTAHTGAIQETAPTTVEGVNQRVTELSTTFKRETSMIYAMIKEKQDYQALQRARVNRLFRDRRYHAHTARLIEGEARASRMAWTQLMDASDAARSGVIALRTQVSAQRTEITNLRAADRRFQTTVGIQQEEIKELRAAHRKLQAQFIRALTALKSCQTQLTAALGRIQILEAAKVSAQLEGVAKALAACDADRNTNSDDSHVSGTGVVELTEWFEKMETVFHISNCSMENQIKFSTWTLLRSALTWWNSHIMTTDPDSTYAMT
nr:reverse transcriptase domain-containing protein [Tanacetum cinerariifolium]